jgi:hypothetical protein
VETSIFSKIRLSKIGSILLAFPRLPDKGKHRVLRVLLHELENSLFPRGGPLSSPVLGDRVIHEPEIILNLLVRGRVKVLY